MRRAAAPGRATTITIATRLGTFAAGLRYEDLPPDVLDKARACLAHGLLVGAAGRLSAAGDRAESAVAAAGGPAHLLTSGRRATTAHAALVNASLLHARAQEDTHGTSHLGSIVHPTALAVGEETGAKGRELLTAIVVGYEVAAALSAPGTPRSSARGFRASSVYGPFAAAAVTAKLRGLDAEACATALTYAAAFAGGTMQAFAEGTPEWQIQNGVAAHNGIIAAGIAATGAPGAPTGIEGAAGFLAAVCGTTEGADEIGLELGSRWAMREVAFKLYPVCAFNQAPAAIAAGLAQEHHLGADEIADVRVDMNAYEAAYPGMDGCGPFTTTGETQMSTRFCVGSALVRRDLGYRDLERFADPDVTALIGRINVVPDPERRPMTVHMTLRTTDGRTLEDGLENPESYFSWGFDRSRSTAVRLGDELGLADAELDDLLDRLATIESRTAADVLEPLLRSYSWPEVPGSGTRVDADMPRRRA